MLLDQGVLCQAACFVRLYNRSCGNLNLKECAKQVSKELGRATHVRIRTTAKGFEADLDIGSIHNIEGGHIADREIEERKRREFGARVPCQSHLHARNGHEEETSVQPKQECN